MSEHNEINLEDYVGNTSSNNGVHSLNGASLLSCRERDEMSEWSKTPPESDGWYWVKSRSTGTEEVMVRENGAWAFMGAIKMVPGHDVALGYEFGQRIPTNAELCAASQNATVRDAAPDLLAACKLWIAYCEENCQSGVITHAEVESAVRAAIAKAQTESES